MIVVRPFLNSDPPKLVELWNHQPISRGLAQPMAVTLLEAQVLAKPYFQPKNLLIAEIEGKLAGMAHLVLSGPLLPEDLRTGIANLPIVLAANIPEAAEVEDALIHAAEGLARETSATSILLGGTSDPGPFYFGLAKGSCNRGALVSDTRMIELAARHGFDRAQGWRVYSRALRGFRPPVDRNQIAARRSLNVMREDDPPFASYRDACIYMHQHRTRYSLIQKKDSQELAHLTVVQMEAFSHLRGVRMSGIVDMDSLNACTQVQAQFFLAETLRQMTEEGTAVVETQVAADNEVLTQVVDTLGFEVIDELRLMSKPID
ncbi:hypothetical protein [Bremerella sp. P1]|uniref:hypothetical protein n=1 Tax=Bremerella sp. P1 TaxID=3026424 RepID=UPI002368A392|nr:hypothetical protein [Bremerella sp. P1]WDI42040.1 hypothetical protein PSR63_26665 [Bremerella sp. P1]